MRSIAHLSGLLGLISAAQAHMEMAWPPPFRSRNNPFTTSIDYNLIDPLRADGSNFPCKGYHSLMDTAQGRPVVTWEPGQNYNFTIVGTATHSGGSCQASLSYDRGNTWTVIQSFHGGCPLRPNWDFTLPVDTPAGDALFAWSWFNRVGNREMYMNCARITIKEPASRRSESEAAGVARRGNTGTAFSSRPDMFVANVNNGCGTREMFDVVFPDPGPNLSGVSDRPAAPIGNCGRQVGNTLSTSTTNAPTATVSSALSQAVRTSTRTSSSAVSNPTGAAKLWEQCGGANWSGPMRCDAGLECNRQDEWYSQCIPPTKKSSSVPVVSSSHTTTSAAQATVPTIRTTTDVVAQTTSTSKPATTSSVNPPSLAAVWGQCDGTNWNGPKACQPGLVCNRQTEWYSQCIPA